MVPEIGKLLDEGFDLGRRAPGIKVDPSEDALPSGSVFLQLKRRRLQVDGERQVADGTSGLNGSFNYVCRK